MSTLSRPTDTHLPLEGMVKRLAWDTNFFGFPIARLERSKLDEDTARAAISLCQEAGIRCLYYEADVADLESHRVAGAHQFLLVDVRMTLERHLKGELDEAPGVGPYRQEEIPTLEEIARQSCQSSRFAVDPGFPPGSAERLYATWITNSCHGYSDQVLVARLSGEAAGFIALDLRQGGGRIALVGVDPSCRGRGIGESLVSAALDWFGERKATSVRVVTQGRNLAAQRLYQRMGFRTSSISLFYHKWF